MAATAAVEDIAAIPVESIEKAIQEQEQEYDEENQLFDEHEALHKRLGKSLYYGGAETTSADRLSLPLTELCVDHFNRVMDIDCSETSGKANDEKERLDMPRAAQVSRETCASPTSLVLALLYLDRLRGSNPRYLSSVSSADLFLVSLMVASKYLHDDGEEDEVFNDEWATSGGVSRNQLNRLELEFLSSIDWRLHVTPAEFETMANSIERAVARKQLNIRHWEQLTYTDLTVLTRPVKASAVWDHFAGLTLKLTTVVVAAYAATLVGMIGTCHLLDQFKLGPAAISQSVNTLYASLRPRDPATNDTSCCLDAAPSDLIFMERATAVVGCNETDFCTNHPMDCEVLPHKGTAPLLRCVPMGDALEDWRYKIRGFPVDPGNPHEHHRPSHKLTGGPREVYIGSTWLH